MPKTMKELMKELHELMDKIAREGNEVDYVAVLDFTTTGVDLVRAESHYVNKDRPLDRANIARTQTLEKQNFELNPYLEDKMINAKSHLYRFSPTGIDGLVIMFGCYDHGDVDTFRFACKRSKDQIIQIIKEMEKA